MKNFFTFLCALMIFTATVKAEALPKIPAPSYTKESYTLKLTQAEIDNLQAWAKNVKVDLKDAIKDSSDMKGEERLTYLKFQIEAISNRYKEQANIFVRYSLNRSLKLVQIIEEQDESAENSVLDVKLRLLTQSLKIAEQYADFDFARFKEFGFTTYARFGADYYALVSELAKSIFDASAQYEMYKISLEYLQWDLYRELDNTQFAPTIVRINNFLNNQPKAIQSDKQRITEIRNIKNFISKLDVRQYQGAVEYNEIANIIKDAVDKNKNFNMNTPYQINEKIILWESYKNEAINGQTVTILEAKSYSGYVLGYIVQDPKTRKKYNIIDTENVYRTNGCIRDTEFCIGVPVVDSMLRSPVTIIGISLNSGVILVQHKDGKIERTLPGALYRRSGCNAKLNVCIGDKLVSKYIQDKVKYVTAISGSDWGLIFVGDSIYDEKFELDSTSSNGKL